MYKIEDLITDKNRELFNQVDKKYKVKLEKSSGDTWGFKIVDGFGIITYVETNYPESCFVHELLHLDTQLHGYRNLKYGFSDAFMNEELVGIIKALDNELQHHKMFTKYIELGYDEKEFYIDSDSETYQKLKSYIKNHKYQPAQRFVQYLSLLAPGGTLNDKQILFLDEAFKKLDKNAYRGFFENIQKVIKDWTNDESYDAEPYLKRLFEVIYDGDKTWFGYGSPDEFPENGFFVGEEFEIDPLEDSPISFSFEGEGFDIDLNEV